jgi:hypothetical protein
MLRALDLVFDGIRVGRIGQGATLTVQVPDGAREIWGRMDWGETVSLPLAACGPEATVVFKGRFTLNLFRNLGVAELPFAVSVRGAREKGAV